MTNALKTEVDWSLLWYCIAATSAALISWEVWGLIRPHWMNRHLPAVREGSLLLGVAPVFGLGQMHRYSAAASPGPALDSAQSLTWALFCRAFTRWADQLGPIYRFRIMWISVSMHFMPHSGSPVLIAASLTNSGLL